MGAYLFLSMFELSESPEVGEGKSSGEPSTECFPGCLCRHEVPLGADRLKDKIFSASFAESIITR